MKMKRQHRCILLVFIIWASLKTSFSLPVPEDELDTSTRLLGSSVVTSVSVVTGSVKDGGGHFQSRKVVPGLDLPPSPAGLLRPDRFQFYTLNKDGEVVTKQMTEKEIQSLIAAGGGHLPTEIHDTQMAGEVPTGGMKVADVVQNVQNVLKSELSKPTTVMTSVPTIPGHANDEWSSILPSILAGDMESQTLNIPESEVITEVETRDPVPEVGVKPTEPDSSNIKTQAISEVKPILEASSSGSKFEFNASSVSSTKAPDSMKISENKSTTTKKKPSVSEHHIKKPVTAVERPHDSISSGTHYEPISTYSTSKPSIYSEKLSSKPTRPSSSDSYSKFPIPEESPIFLKPFKPVEPSKPEQGHKPQISVRPDPQSYEEKPLVSVGPDKFKFSTPSYVLLTEKQTQDPSRTTVTKKPTTFETSSKPSYSFRPDNSAISYSEIPMIPVQVITADQVSTSTPQHLKDNSPVFQVLNTISADAVSGSNSSKIDIQKEAMDEKPSKYQHPVFKPDKTDVQVPEQIVTEKPKTPLPEIVFADTSLYTKLPDLMTTSIETKTPDIVSVVSETYSTSIKIPGLSEIPIPTGTYGESVITPKPETKTTLSMYSSMKNYTELSSGDESLEEDKHKDEHGYQSSASETKVPPTLLADKEVTTQKMFELEAITTDLISEATTFDTPDTTTLNINKESETTTDSTFETSTIPALEEIQFQKIPDIIADGQIISPETSAIEKIIETLHHPTESKFGISTMIDINTETTDLTTESEFSTKFTILDEETSTLDYTTFASSQWKNESKSAATEENSPLVENKMETSTIPTILKFENTTDGTQKPYEPLPTELADSLSSMISQISETIPSFLPVSQSSLLTEVPSEEDNKYSSTKIDIYQQDTESTRVTQGLPNFETTMYKNMDVDIGATVRLEDATETFKNVEINSSSEPEMPSVTHSNEMKNESMKGDLFSNGPGDSISSTVSFSTASLSTAATTESSKSPSIPGIDQTTKSNNGAQDQIPLSAESQKVSSIDMTEKPIIRLSVTESGKMNLPQINNKEKGNSESTVIRIQTSDAVSMINNLLESAPAQTTASYVPLILPASENSSPNNIGSSLVAGFLTGKETSVASEKNSVQSELLTHSNTPPNSEIRFEPAQILENKTKDTVHKIEYTVGSTEDSVGKTQDNEDKIRNTEEKIKNDAKNTEEKDKDEVKIIEEKTKNTDKDKMKVNEESEIPSEIIKIPSILEEESTTEKGLSISTINFDKIESTTKKVEETRTESSSTETGISSTEIKKESTTTSSSSPALTREGIITTTEASMDLQNVTISTLDKNQKETSSGIQSTTENLIIIKENITAVENITDIPSFAEISPSTKKNESETIFNAKKEPIITTTSKPVMETTIITTVKSNFEAKTTTPKSNIENETTVSKSNLEIVVTTPKSKTTSPEPFKVVSQIKTRKPETPVVRIDISPETSQPDLPPIIQMTDIPIIDKITKKPDDSAVMLLNASITDEKLSMENLKPVNSKLNISKGSNNISNESLSSDEKQKKVDPIIDGNVEQSLKNSTQEGQEIRIRVNDTAVLVSKLPPISINETRTSIVDEEVNSSTNASSIPDKEIQVERTKDKINLMPTEAPKNSPEKEQKKSDNNTTLDQKNKPSVNETKLITNNITKTVDSGKIIDNKLPNVFKPITVEPVIKIPPSIQKDNIDQNNENAYNKLGEFTPTESTKKKPSTPFQKKNVTSNISKPFFGLNSKPINTARPSTASGATKPSTNSSDIKPGSSFTKPSLPSKNRPSSHETSSHKPTESTKIKKPNDNSNTEEKWALIPQQSTSSSTKTPKPTASTTINTKEVPRPQAQQPQVALDASQSAIGLDGSIMNLDPDVVNFSNLCNELAFSFWSAANKGLSTSRSLALSPFGMTSLLAMVFLGARGPTSHEMNDVLKLDDVATFNPHLVFQNVTDTVSLTRRQGISNAAFVRELFADKSKVGKLMPFYKEQAQQFYEGFVEEVNFAAISDIVRRRTNLLVRKQTGGRIRDFVKTNTVALRPPLAALSANVFQTECNSSAASSEGRDGELYFAVSPAVRQRKLIPVPATVWKSGVLAGYEPSLDATAIALGGMEKLVSIIFVIPGQQGHMAPGDNLDNLEVRLVRGAQRDGAWNKLLKVLIPRTSLELQVPKFSHRSIVNATAALKRMGLAELFSKHADLKGINGIGHDLHLADVLQMNLFSTCGDEHISSGRHHVEIYPGPPMRNFRKMTDYDESLDAFADGDFHSESEESPSDVSSDENDPTSEESTGRTSRQSEISEKPRLKLDRPFIYFVRHNPTGLILHMGRFNPRLLP